MRRLGRLPHPAAPQAAVCRRARASSARDHRPRHRCCCNRWWQASTLRGTPATPEARSKASWCRCRLHSWSTSRRTACLYPTARLRYVEHHGGGGAGDAPAGGTLPRPPQAGQIPSTSQIVFAGASIGGLQAGCAPDPLRALCRLQKRARLRPGPCAQVPQLPELDARFLVDGDYRRYGHAWVCSSLCVCIAALVVNARSIRPAATQHSNTVYSVRWHRPVPHDTALWATAWRRAVLEPFAPHLERTGRPGRPLCPCG